MIVLLYVFAGGILLCLYLFNALLAIVPSDWANIAGAVFIAIAAIHFGISLLVAEDRRQRALLEFAAAKGWVYRLTQNWSWHRRYGDVDIFFRGRSKSVRNLMLTDLKVQSHTLPVEMGDYAYTVGWGESSKRYRLSYLVVRLPAPIPAILLRPENFGDRVMSAAGFNDIDFESKAFSDRYMVGCTDKKFAFRLISPLVMQFLMEKPAVPGLPSFSISDGWLGISGIDQYWHTDQFESALEWTRRFIELWPQELLEPQMAESP